MSHESIEALDEWSVVGKELQQNVKENEDGFGSEWYGRVLMIPENEMNKRAHR